MGEAESFQSYDRVAARNYDRYAFIWRLYPPLIQGLHALDAGQSVLDLGCGTGSLLIHLHDGIARGVGIDESPAMVRRAREKAQERRISNLDFRVGRIEEMELADSFDLVTCTDGVLAYLDESGLERVFSMTATVLEPRGRALLEFWTREANRPPAKARKAMPRRIENICARLTNEPFQWEASEHAATKETVYRVHLPGKDHSFTIVESMDGTSIHHHFFVAPEPMRRLLNDYGLRVVSEHALSREGGALRWASYDGHGEIWTVTVSRGR